MSKHKTLLLGLLSLIYSALTNAEVTLHPPAQMVDKEACPFECCTYYREWTVEEDTELLSTYKSQGEVIAKLKKGSRVNAITGIVNTTMPGLIKVLYDFQNQLYRKGDLIYVYTYTGEGYYKVWFKQDIHQMEISFLAGWARCEVDNTCWGKVITEPKSTWWIKIEDNEGNIGWTNKSDHFGNNDACG